MIQFPISSNARALARDLRAVRPTAMKNIAKRLDYENQITVRLISREWLSVRGPETLGVVTNRYRSSLRNSAAVLVGNEVESAIGTNVAPYPRAHEFGFHASVTVRAHKRNVFRTHSTGGGSVFNPKTGKITKQRKREVQLLQGQVDVKQHWREMNIKERAPIRRGIQARREAYGAAMSQAVVDAWNATT